jgi:hypothetical protein
MELNITHSQGEEDCAKRERVRTGEDSQDKVDSSVGEQELAEAENKPQFWRRDGGSGKVNGVFKEGEAVIALHSVRIDYKSKVVVDGFEILRIVENSAGSARVNNKEQLDLREDI